MHYNFVRIPLIDVEAFAKPLGDAREARSMTLQRFAKEVGVSTAAVWCWEKGRARPGAPRSPTKSTAATTSISRHLPSVKRGTQAFMKIAPGVCDPSNSRHISIEIGSDFSIGRPFDEACAWHFRHAVLLYSLTNLNLNLPGIRYIGLPH
jgi:transcriptional regulator with XRE-family HTH domain